MDIKTLYPINPGLKEYIDYYYFLKIDDPKSEINYLAYPHVNNPLSICKGVSTIIEKNEFKVSSSRQDLHSTIAFGYFEDPVSIRVKGKIDEITIVFKPLGLNHFIKQPFNKVINKTGGYFSAWDSLVYKKTLSEIFSQNDIQQRVIILEKFLFSILTTFTQFNVINNALELLTDFDKNYSIGYISSQLSVHTRTLHRMFTQQLGISPKAYKKIAQFRHSLEHYPEAKNKLRLIDVAYASNYYDHSYFIKMYKDLAHTNPKKFFSSTELNANNKFLMTVLKG